MDDKQIDDRQGRKGGYGRLWSGLFFLLIGGILLLDQMGFPFPDWLFNWHVLLIAIGLFIGFRHNFRGGAWLILIMVGSFYLVQDNFPEWPVHRFIWPAVLIGVGLIFILRPHHRRFGDRRWDNGPWGERRWDRCRNDSPAAETPKYSSEDWFESTAIFSGVHK